MVWRSKGALLSQLIDAMQMAGDGMDARDGECSLAVQTWQQPRQLMGQVGLAAARAREARLLSRQGQGSGPVFAADVCERLQPIPDQGWSPLRC